MVESNERKIKFFLLFTYLKCWVDKMTSFKHEKRRKKLEHSTHFYIPYPSVHVLLKKSKKIKVIFF